MSLGSSFVFLYGTPSPAVCFSQIAGLLSASGPARPLPYPSLWKPNPGNPRHQGTPKVKGCSGTISIECLRGRMLSVADLPRSLTGSALCATGCGLSDATVVLMLRNGLLYLPAQTSWQISVVV